MAGGPAPAAWVVVVVRGMVMMPVGATEPGRYGQSDDEGKHKPYQGRRQGNRAESTEHIVRIPATGRPNPHRGDERGRLSRHLLSAAAWVVVVVSVMLA